MSTSQLAFVAIAQYATTQYKKILFRGRGYDDGELEQRASALAMSARVRAVMFYHVRDSDGIGGGTYHSSP